MKAYKTSIGSIGPQIEAIAQDTMRYSAHPHEETSLHRRDNTQSTYLTFKRETAIDNQTSYRRDKRERQRESHIDSRAPYRSYS